MSGNLPTYYPENSFSERPRPPVSLLVKLFSQRDRSTSVPLASAIPPISLPTTGGGSGFSPSVVVQRQRAQRIHRSMAGVLNENGSGVPSHPPGRAHAVHFSSSLPRIMDVDDINDDMYGMTSTLRPDGLHLSSESFVGTSNTDFENVLSQNLDLRERVNYQSLPNLVICPSSPEPLVTSRENLLDASPPSKSSSQNSNIKSRDNKAKIFKEFSSPSSVVDLDDSDAQDLTLNLLASSAASLSCLKVLNQLLKSMRLTESQVVDDNLAEVFQITEIHSPFNYARSSIQKDFRYLQKLNDTLSKQLPSQSCNLFNCLNDQKDDEGSMAKSDHCCSVEVEEPSQQVRVLLESEGSLNPLSDDQQLVQHDSRDRLDQLFDTIIENDSTIDEVLRPPLDDNHSISQVESSATGDLVEYYDSTSMTSNKDSVTTKRGQSQFENSFPRPEFNPPVFKAEVEKHPVSDSSLTDSVETLISHCDSKVEVIPKHPDDIHLSRNQNNGVQKVVCSSHVHFSDQLDADISKAKINKGTIKGREMCSRNVSVDNFSTEKDVSSPPLQSFSRSINKELFANVTLIKTDEAADVSPLRQTNRHFLSRSLDSLAHTETPFHLLDHAAYREYLFSFLQVPHISDRFHQLKNFYATLDRISQMERHVPWNVNKGTNGKRYLTSSVPELQQLYDTLDAAERKGEFWYRAGKDKDRLRWSYDKDRWLKYKARSVQDLQRIFLNLQEREITYSSRSSNQTSRIAKLSHWKPLKCKVVPILPGSSSLQNINSRHSTSVADLVEKYNWIDRYNLPVQKQASTPEYEHAIKLWQQTNKDKLARSRGETILPSLEMKNAIQKSAWNVQNRSGTPVDMILSSDNYSGGHSPNIPTTESEGNDHRQGCDQRDSVKNQNKETVTTSNSLWICEAPTVSLLTADNVNVTSSFETENHFGVRLKSVSSPWVLHSVGSSQAILEDSDEGHGSRSSCDSEDDDGAALISEHGKESSLELRKSRNSSNSESSLRVFGRSSSKCNSNVVRGNGKKQGEFISNYFSPGYVPEHTQSSWDLSDRVTISPCNYKSHSNWKRDSALGLTSSSEERLTALKCTKTMRSSKGIQPGHRWKKKLNNNHFLTMCKTGEVKKLAAKFDSQNAAELKVKPVFKASQNRSSSLFPSNRLEYVYDSTLSEDVPRKTYHVTSRPVISNFVTEKSNNKTKDSEDSDDYNDFGGKSLGHLIRIYESDHLIRWLFGDHKKITDHWQPPNSSSFTTGHFQTGAVSQLRHHYELQDRKPSNSWRSSSKDTKSSNEFKWRLESATKEYQPASDNNQLWVLLGPSKSSPNLLVDLDTSKETDKTYQYCSTPDRLDSLSSSFSPRLGWSSGFAVHNRTDATSRRRMPDISLFSPRKYQRDNFLNESGTLKRFSKSMDDFRKLTSNSDTSNWQSKNINTWPSYLRNNCTSITGNVRAGIAKFETRNPPTTSWSRWASPQSYVYTYSPLITSTPLPSPKLWSPKRSSRLISTMPPPGKESIALKRPVPPPRRRFTSQKG